MKKYGMSIGLKVTSHERHFFSNISFRLIEMRCFLVRISFYDRERKLYCIIERI